MRNTCEDNSHYFFKENSGDDIKISNNNNMSSTSLKDDSIKNDDNNNFYFNQSSEKDAAALFQNPIMDNMLSIPISPEKITSKSNQKKIFNILKTKRCRDNESESNSLNDSLSLDCGIDSELEGDLDLNDQKSENRVSAKSKVNFSKLTEIEKDERLKNLAKLVKRLRRKTRNLEQRFKKNANKMLNRYISNSLGIKKYKTVSDATNNIPLNFNIDILCKSLKMLRSYDKFEYSDQKHAIENFIKLIAEEKLQLDSLNFRKICTQIRLFLNREQSEYISNKGQKITFSFPEKDINITTKEYELYSKYKDKEEIIRSIIGIPEEKAQHIYPERINFETKKAIKNFYQDPECSSNNNNINYKALSNHINTNSISSTNYLNGNASNNNAGSLNSNNYSNFSTLEDQLKNFSINNINLNDVMNLGIISNNGNLHNLLLNSIYSNLIQNFSSQNNPC